LWVISIYNADFADIYLLRRLASIKVLWYNEFIIIGDFLSVLSVGCITVNFKKYGAFL